MEDTAHLVHLPLPTRPDELDLDELEKAAGGGGPIIVDSQQLSAAKLSAPLLVRR
jgi:hypothetical protein